MIQIEQKIIKIWLDLHNIYKLLSLQTDTEMVNGDWNMNDKIK